MQWYEPLNKFMLLKVRLSSHFIVADPEEGLANPESLKVIVALGLEIQQAAAPYLMQGQLNLSSCTCT